VPAFLVSKFFKQKTFPWILQFKLSALHDHEGSQNSSHFETFLLTVAKLKASDIESSK
jgi:hypothetical protein